jgi:hypothetical protein
METARAPLNFSHEPLVSLSQIESLGIGFSDKLNTDLPPRVTTTRITRCKASQSFHSNRSSLNLVPVGRHSPVVDRVFLGLELMVVSTSRDQSSTRVLLHPW